MVNNNITTNEDVAVAVTAPTDAYQNVFPASDLADLQLSPNVLQVSNKILYNKSSFRCILSIFRLQY